MFTARIFSRPLWRTVQNPMRKCSSEAPVTPKKKRRILAGVGKGVAGAAVVVPTVGGVYYLVSDDITKRQIRVTVQGVGRFFRWVLLLVMLFSELVQGDDLGAYWHML